MYDQTINRAHPGCIVFLIDQSASMNEQFAGTNRSKAVALAQAVNQLIRNLVLQCQRGDQIRGYFDIGIVGYGSAAGSAFGGGLAGQQLVPINSVAELPTRFVTDSLPGNPDLRIEQPVWVEPVAHGATRMTAAIDLAGSFIVNWANAHQDSFPPIVLNFSDGQATDGDPRGIAGQLRQIVTKEGNLLLFNINLSSAAQAPVEYPSSPQGLPNGYAIGLFEMSSELPPLMHGAAQEMGLPVGPGARGYVFNADSARLTEFLDVGTRVPVADQ